MQAWHTLLELKEDHHILGFKGSIFFIVDFSQDIYSGKIHSVISTPTFTGLGVTAGISSFIIAEGEEKELFNVPEKTFKQHSKELEAAYFGNSENA